MIGEITLLGLVKKILVTVYSTWCFKFTGLMNAKHTVGCVSNFVKVTVIGILTNIFNKEEFTEPNKIGTKFHYATTMRQ